MVLPTHSCTGLEATWFDRKSDGRRIKGPRARPAFGPHSPPERAWLGHLSALNINFMTSAVKTWKYVICFIRNEPKWKGFKETQHWKTRGALLKRTYGNSVSYHQWLCPYGELAISKLDRTADPTSFSSPIIHVIVVLFCTDLAEQACMGSLFSKPERTDWVLLLLLYQDLAISKLIKSRRLASAWKAKFIQNN